MSLDARLAELAERGYTIVPDALSAAETAATRRAVRELLDAEEPVARSTGTQTDNLRNAHAIVGKHPHFHEFYLNPPVMDIVRAVLGDGALLYDGNIRVPMPTGQRDAAKGFQVHVDREDYTVLPFAGGTHYPMAIKRGLVPGRLRPPQRRHPALARIAPVVRGAGPGPGAERSRAGRGARRVRNRLGRRALAPGRHQPRRRAALDGDRLLPASVAARQDRQHPHAAPGGGRAHVRRRQTCLVGVTSAAPDYSEVKALDDRQLAELTLEQRTVLGFPVY